MHNTRHEYLQKYSTAGNINIQHKHSGIQNWVFTGRYGLDLQMQFALICLKWTCMAQYIDRLLTAYARDFSRCDICGRWSWVATGFFSQHTVLPRQYHSTIAPRSL
jgi:hypothetical protein